MQVWARNEKVTVFKAVALLLRVVEAAKHDFRFSERSHSMHMLFSALIAKGSTEALMTLRQCKPELNNMFMTTLGDGLRAVESLPATEKHAATLEGRPVRDPSWMVATIRSANGDQNVWILDEIVVDIWFFQVEQCIHIHQ